MTTMPCQQHCCACTTTLTLPTAQCEMMRAVTACHVLVSVPYSTCHDNGSTIAMPVPRATTALPHHFCVDTTTTIATTTRQGMYAYNNTTASTASLCPCHHHDATYCTHA